MHHNKVLSIDLAYRNQGWAVFQGIEKNRPILLKSGQFAVEDEDKKYKMTAKALQYVQFLIKQNRPEVVVIEMLKHGKDKNSAEGAGICHCLCGMIHLTDPSVEILQYLPTRIKKAVAGESYAKKHDIIAWCDRYYPKSKWSQGVKFEHEADAIAIGFYYYIIKGHIMYNPIPQ